MQATKQPKAPKNAKENDTKAIQKTREKMKQELKDPEIRAVFQRLKDK